ncbi:hypothetical protein XJ32_02870 [Helicobacter bilis]|uniref:Uncharacterized protein n=1 Tax=Helicobacter bilis TaxID=37372 RepID=A0A1Q2LFN1_9HELI|nr:hypothetical protein [Helicobacter bilis]AQQ59218.1 hypothetical protein XJ32_02870 [Helicobacter bilis]
MQYFVTIYIDTMKPKLDFMPFTIPHAFLGLTHTHPDELDSQGNIEIEKYSNPRYDSFIGCYLNTIKKDKGKWYERVYPSILSDEFEGEGFFGFGPVTHARNHWGKVYENNQYAPEGNNVVNEYVEPYYYKERSLSTFWQQNRCVFEISKEQYEKLLDSIKTEVEQTRKRTPNLKQDDTQLDNPIKNLYYNSNPMSSDPIHNCVTWVLNKLDSIGIEIIDSKEWLPDVIPNLSPSALARKVFMKYAFDMEVNFINTLKDSLADLAYYHTIFRKFQSIDSNLKSIKGAKAFRTWARGMIGNRFVCKLDQNYNRLSKHDITCSSEDEGFVATLQSWKEKLQHTREQLRYVYAMLDKILSSQIQKAENLGYTNIQGDFTFISYDKQSHKIVLRSKDKDYEPYEESQLDPSIPMNNWTLNQYAPYIFNPKDTILSRCLYKNYHYPSISQGYTDSIFQSYLAILSGNDDLRYWSETLHKIRKAANA